MAGAGFKDFAVGEVLTASDVDTYLMQQSVMRFADSAARGSALGTATGAGTALAEGMVSYLDDVNVVEVYTGSGWRAPGAGIGSNVVSTTKTDVWSAASTSFTDVTGLAVTITPTSATSKVLVLASFMSSSSTISNAQTVMRLVRDATPVGIGDAAGNRSPGFGGGVGWNVSHPRLNSIIFLDSPATTSVTTYQIQMLARSGTMYVGRSGDDSDASYSARSASFITAIEVAA